jgi:hypothetical protein
MGANGTVGGEYSIDGADHCYRMVRVDVTGLVAGPNIIPHHVSTPNGGQVLPQWEEVLLTSAVQVHRTQPADATNLYYTVDSGAGTTISVRLWV